MKAVAGILSVLFLYSGCGAVRSYREMQIANDTQALLRKYRACVEANQATPEVIEKLCSPYLAVMPAATATVRHPDTTAVWVEG
ncbi:MAG: hypothetical protein ACRERD_15515, partial [Candidatus Binatia bacterium]